MQKRVSSIQRASKHVVLWGLSCYSWCRQRLKDFAVYKGGTLKSLMEVVCTSPSKADAHLFIMISVRMD